MVITTTNDVQGKTIKQYLGVVNTNFVLGTNFLSEIKVAFSDIFGGTSGTYKNKLNIIYEKAIKELQTKAYDLHADAIVGLSVDFDEVSGSGVSMLMVSATGTAVSFDKDLGKRFSMYNVMSQIYDYKVKGFITQEEYEYEIQRVKSLYENSIEAEMKAIEEDRINQKILLEEEEKQRIDSLKTMEERIQDKFSFLQGDDIMNISDGDVEASSYDDIDFDGNDPVEYTVAKFIRLKRIPEACKFYMDETGFDDLNAALDYCINIQHQIDSIDQEALTSLVNKIKVLKKRGYTDQAISEYQKLTLSDRFSAIEFIDKLSE